MEFRQFCGKCSEMQTDDSTRFAEHLRNLGYWLIWKSKQIWLLFTHLFIAVLNLGVFCETKKGLYTPSHYRAPQTNNLTSQVQQVSDLGSISGRLL